MGTLKEIFAPLLMAFLVFSSACIGYGEKTNTGGTSSYNSPASSHSLLTEVPPGIVELGTLAEYGNVTVVRATYGYVISKNGTKVFLNVSRAYFFPWGFVVVEKTPALREIPLVKANLTTTYSCLLYTSPSPRD
jgi:hypothetical protein